MATIVNDNADHVFWLKHPDGKIQEIPPKALSPLTPGVYEIASVEIVPGPKPHIPNPNEVTIVNVGQETLVFKSVFPTFELKEKERKVLEPATYNVTSKHVH